MIINWLILYLLFAQPVPSVSVDHDLHLSKTEIEYNSASESIEIILHLFIDDMEEAIGRYDTTSLHLCTSQEIINADVYINEYIKRNFKISSNQKGLNWNFLGKETSEDLFAIWCYLEIEKPILGSDVSVEVTLFNELYDDQKNVVKLLYDEKHKDYFLLDHKRTVGSISIE